MEETHPFVRARKRMLQTSGLGLLFVEDVEIRADQDFGEPQLIRIA